MPNGKKKKKEDPILEALRQAAPADVAAAYLPVQKEATVLQPLQPRRLPSIRSVEPGSAADLALHPSLFDLLIGGSPGQHRRETPEAEVIASLIGNPIELVEGPAAFVGPLSRSARIARRGRQYTREAAEQYREVLKRYEDLLVLARKDKTGFRHQLRETAGELDRFHPIQSAAGRLGFDLGYEGSARSGRLRRLLTPWTDTRYLEEASEAGETVRKQVLKELGPVPESTRYRDYVNREFFK
jgi:hypothetical protein